MSFPALERAYIGLGGNLDHPDRRIRRAFDALKRLPSTTLVRTSSLYRTAPVGFLDQPDFINAVAAVDTALSPLALLDALLNLELEAGRARSFKNAPRTLDLDVLLYGSTVLEEERLILPHPRMATRAFVLIPLLEIAPTLVIPTLGPLAQLAAQCDPSGIQKLESSPP